MSSGVPVTVDVVRFDRKPQGGEIGGITRRLQAGGHTVLGPEQFAQAVADGRTWVGACYEPCSGGWGEFVGQRLFGLDFDNDTPILDERGKPKKDDKGHVLKRQLLPDEAGYLDPWRAIDRCAELFGSKPLVMYPSFRFRFGGTEADRWSTETRMKFRLVLDAGEFVTDEQRARGVAAKLLRAFPESDKRCSNNNRLYFGSCGKAVAYIEGGPLYVRRS